jgi:hypothetical protein
MAGTIGKGSMSRQTLDLHSRPIKGRWLRARKKHDLSCLNGIANGLDDGRIFVGAKVQGVANCGPIHSSLVHLDHLEGIGFIGGKVRQMLGKLTQDHVV